jgi:alanine dehydrogenase
MTRLATGVEEHTAAAGFVKQRKRIAMLVGVPKELKDNEYRVGIVPSTVRELTDNGHRVLIERQAGAGAGFGDADYQGAGGEIVFVLSRQD